MVVAKYGYLWNFERLIFWGDVGYLYLKPSVLYPTYCMYRENKKAGTLTDNPPIFSS